MVVMVAPDRRCQVLHIRELPAGRCVRKVLSQLIELVCFSRVPAALRRLRGVLQVGCDLLG